jgi:hypothetical protein
MHINRCPKCGREPTRVRHETISRKTFGHEIVCRHCDISTSRLKLLCEAIAKWNEITKGVDK